MMWFFNLLAAIFGFKRLEPKLRPDVATRSDRQRSVVDLNVGDAINRGRVKRATKVVILTEPDGTERVYFRA